MEKIQFLLLPTFVNSSCSDTSYPSINILKQQRTFFLLCFSHWRRKGNPAGAISGEKWLALWTSSIICLASYNFLFPLSKFSLFKNRLPLNYRKIVSPKAEVKGSWARVNKQLRGSQIISEMPPMTYHLFWSQGTRHWFMESLEGSYFFFLGTDGPCHLNFRESFSLQEQKHINVWRNLFVFFVVWLYPLLLVSNRGRQPVRPWCRLACYEQCHHWISWSLSFFIREL